jgi:hypothetical protein
MTLQPGDKRTFAFLWGCALLGGIVLGLALPPFQFPDEPHHFAAVLIASRGESERDSLEGETIRLMDRFDWWRLTGMGRPVELPRRISEVKFLMADSRSIDFRARIQGFVLYHKIAGRMLAVLGARDPAVSYFILRLLSLVFYLGGLALLAPALRTFARAWDVDSGGLFALAVFLPQLSFVGIGVAPDALVFFLGAAFCWAAAGIIAGEIGFARIAVLIAAAGLGFLTDRSAFVWAALLVLIPFFTIRRVNADRTVGGTVLALVASILFVYVLALRFPLPFESGALALKSVAGSLKRALPTFFAFGPFERAFWLQFADSAFLRLGWMHFGPPRAFVWAWRLIWISGFIGLALGFVDFIRRRSRGKEAEAGSIRGRLVLFCLAGVLIQALGLWTFYGSTGIMPQGRYLFPVLAPFLGLLTAGVSRLGDAIRPSLGRRMLLACAVFLAFVWIYALWAIAFPIFRMTVAAPFPGV